MHDFGLYFELGKTVVFCNTLCDTTKNTGESKGIKLDHMKFLTVHSLPKVFNLPFTSNMEYLIKTCEIQENIQNS